MTDQFSGKCLCGAVSYTALGQPVIVAQCHCESCRRTSGTGHTIGAMFPRHAVSVQGKLAEFKYQSDLGSDVTKAFCPKCSSPILGENSRNPDFVTLPLGSMEHASSLAVQVVIFARDKQHWDEIGPDIMTFDTQPEWQPNE